MPCSKKKKNKYKNMDSISPRSIVRSSEHYQQKRRWDCGVSCVIMALNDAEKRTELLERLGEVVKEEGFGESTWTIDLCYLLQRLGLDFLYTTTTLGVDPEYASQAFYSRILALDAQRVADRFAHAQSRGMRVEERVASLEEIIGHLATGGPVIALANANMLVCEVRHSTLLCGGGGASSAGKSLTQCWTRRCVDSYQGHYLLIVGYDLDKKMVHYRNPSLKDRVCQMSFQCFEDSRTSFGTDEDLLFVFRDKNDS